MPIPPVAGSSRPLHNPAKSLDRSFSDTTPARFSRLNQFLWWSGKYLYRAALTNLPPTAALQLQFLRTHGKLPNLVNPRTFSEKLQVRKLKPVDPLVAKLTDKVQVKSYVEELLGPKYIIPTLWHGSELPDWSQSGWPVPFVVKANHGSGWNLFVLSADGLDWIEIQRTAHNWLQQDWPAHLCENWYNEIHRQILVEEFYGRNGVPPTEYKFFVFHGRVEYVQVDYDKWTAHRRIRYDRNWTALEPSCRLQIVTDLRPPSFDRMILAAERLAVGFDFIRVDMYDTDRGPKFGELTFAPAGGLERIVPEGFDEHLGGLW